MILHDSHCHLDFDNFDQDRPEVIVRAKSADVRFVVVPGVDLPSSAKAQALTAQHPGFVYSAAGVHPNYVNGLKIAVLDGIRELAKSPGVVAIGEVGLDYYRTYSSKEDQKRFLLAQLALAEELELPVILHDRDASVELVPILLEWQANLTEDHPLKRRPGVMHAYSADLAVAEPLIESNFYFGVGGPVTYENARERKEVVKGLPVERMLLETDAPFLTPHPHRGKRNEPSYIPLIAEAIADLHGITAAEVGKITTRNAIGLFGLPEKGDADRAGTG
ncbi:MAG: TatD family hydrolase [Chloroflexi bacterium]|nr:TatD family hydrolase [Chloroflexota bacterium]